MKIMRFSFGLGNQMFQYATFLQLQRLFGSDECYIDTLWYDITSYPFELEDIFNLKPQNVKSVLNRNQIGYIESKLETLKYWKTVGYEDYRQATKCDNNFVNLTGELSFIEIPQLLIDSGLRLNIVTNKKINLSIADFYEKYKRTSTSGAYKSKTTRLRELNSKAYYYLRVVKNRNVREKFIKDIMNLKSPDFTDYYNTERYLYSNEDSYYNIQGQPSFCEGIRKELLDAFKFKPIEDKINLEILNCIHSSQSVSIHARVNDFDYGMGFLVKNNYYEKAIKHIKKQVKNPEFFVFSDNIEWCKNNLSILGLTIFDNVNFIGHNKGNHSAIDMQLMSHCKHNIVPNSTFSWWGAYINNNPDKVVCTPFATLPATISF